MTDAVRSCDWCAALLVGVERCPRCEPCVDIFGGRHPSHAVWHTSDTTCKRCGAALHAEEETRA